MDVFASFKQIVERKTWQAWFLLCLGVCAIHLLTLSIDPVVSQDEVQIIDFGRTVFEPSSDWGITWHVQESIPILPQPYLGVALQELAFRVSQPSNLGPRIVTMFAAIIAASCALGWLLARNTPRVAAVVLSLSFFLDPIFSEIYRRGRVDGWAIALCLAACWLLRIAKNREESGHTVGLTLFFSGALAATAPFFWAIAAVLYPLVLVEFYFLAKTRWQQEGSSKSRGLAILALPFISGGLSAAAVLLIPLILNWQAFWIAILSNFEIQVRAATIQLSILDLFLVYDPVIFLAILVAILFRREIPLIISLLIAVIIMHETMVYAARIPYLLPYFLALIAGALPQSGIHDQSTVRWKALYGLITLLLLWNAAQVLMVRPYLALQKSPANEPGRYLEVFQDAIGPGNYRVGLENWEGYYAARHLGWKLYRAGSPILRTEYMEFLRSVDYIIMGEKDSYYFNQIDRGKLGEIDFETVAGFRFSETLPPQNSWWILSTWHPMPVYTDFLIYGKRNNGTKPKINHIPK